MYTNKCGAIRCESEMGKRCAAMNGGDGAENSYLKMEEDWTCTAYSLATLCAVSLQPLSW
jgi:hypothetical protein